MLNSDYRDMLYALSEENVRYLLDVAYAPAVHGHVRATGDIDLWVERGEDNVRRVLAALEHLGAPLQI